MNFENIVLEIFPGGPVVRTDAFSAEGAGSILDGGTKIPQAQWYGQKEKKKVVLSERKVQKVG